jgi:type I restriction enzyme S subunit
MMKAGSVVQLGDILHITSGGTPSRRNPAFFENGKIPWFKTGDLKRRDLIESEEKITQEAINNSSAKLFPPDTVLVAMYGATIGACGILKVHGTTNQACGALLPNDKILPEYLYYFILSNKKNFVKLGVGGAQPNISADKLKSFKIAVPSLKDQAKVVEIIRKAESALEKRRQTIRLADEFLKSAFLEMFGDPFSNPKKWPIRNFESSFYSIKYGTGSPPQYQQSGIPFIRATNIKNGTVLSKDMKFISQEDASKIEKCKLSFGDLILVRSGVNAGDCGLIPEIYDGAYAAYDLIIKLPYISAVYFNHLINSEFGRTMLAPLKRRAGQPHLNAEQMSSLQFIAPPIEQQQKFTTLVQKVEKLKEKQKQSETQLQNLFNSLMQRAFKGEL